jgi:hypothetical protein
MRAGERLANARDAKTVDTDQQLEIEKRPLVKPSPAQAGSRSAARPIAASIVSDIARMCGELPPLPGRAGGLAIARYGNPPMAGRFGCAMS